MKKILLLATLCVATTVSAQAQPDAFQGFYVGANVGLNKPSTSNKTEKDKSEFSTGLIAGYHHVFYTYLIGVEAFADLHYESATNDDGGIGLKVGKVMGDSLVFARLGVTGSKPSWRPEYALGVEYKLTKKWSLTGKIAYDRSTDSGIRRSNTSLTAGLNYYLF